MSYIRALGGFGQHSDNTLSVEADIVKRNTISAVAFIKIEAFVKRSFEF